MPRADALAYTGGGKTDSTETVSEIKTFTEEMWEHSAACCPLHFPSLLEAYEFSEYLFSRGFIGLSHVIYNITTQFASVEERKQEGIQDRAGFSSLVLTY